MIKIGYSFHRNFLLCRCAAYNSKTKTVCGEKMHERAVLCSAVCCLYLILMYVLIMKQISRLTGDCLVPGVPHLTNLSVTCSCYPTN
jgi:hypothetical protein